MQLTPDQISELLKIIDYYQVYFIAEHVGQDILTTEDIEILTNAGIALDELPTHPTLEEAFQFGILSSALGDKKTKKMSYPQFKKYISHAGFIPLNAIEKQALMSVKRQSYKDIKGLGNKIGSDMHQLIIEGDKAQRLHYEHIIRDEAFQAIKNRESVKELVGRLGNKTQDWTRDFGRIADYIMHSAFDEGRAVEIQKTKGSNARVYKQPYPGACSICIKLYTTEGLGSEPRIFTLAELQGNGTNIGRKAKELKPVVGATHPWSITDKRTVILTESGWKMIRDIEVGEYVLTHKGRFRKVISKVSGYKPTKDYPIKDIYDINYMLDTGRGKIKMKLSLTAEHKVLTQSGWVMAKDLKSSHKLIKLKKPCSNEECDNYLDGTRWGRRTCSKECESKIASRLALELHTEEIRDKISETSKQNWKDGVYINTLKNLQSDSMREATVERMLNGQALRARRAASMNKTSSFQMRLFKKVKRMYPEAELEHPVNNRSLDIAIPSLKIDIEYDGSYWHNQKVEDDKKRDDMLRDNGWHILRYVDRIPTNRELLEDIQRVANNSSDRYRFAQCDITKISKRKITSETRLWDIGVEEDESFVARGVVIHNCRCTLETVPEGFKWNPETKAFDMRDDEWKPKVKVKSKIKVTFRGKTSEV